MRAPNGRRTANGERRAARAERLRRARRHMKKEQKSRHKHRAAPAGPDVRARLAALMKLLCLHLQFSANLRCSGRPTKWTRRRLIE